MRRRLTRPERAALIEARLEKMNRAVNFIMRSEYTGHARAGQKYQEQAERIVFEEYEKARRAHRDFHGIDAA